MPSQLRMSPQIGDAPCRVADEIPLHSHVDPGLIRKLVELLLEFSPAIHRCRKNFQVPMAAGSGAAQLVFVLPRWRRCPAWTGLDGTGCSDKALMHWATRRDGATPIPTAGSATAALVLRRGRRSPTSDRAWARRRRDGVPSERSPRCHRQPGDTVPTSEPTPGDVALQPTRCLCPNSMTTSTGIPPAVARNRVYSTNLAPMHGLPLAIRPRVGSLRLKPGPYQNIGWLYAQPQGCMMSLCPGERTQICAALQSSNQRRRCSLRCVPWRSRLAQSRPALSRHSRLFGDLHGPPTPPRRGSVPALYKADTTLVSRT